MTSQPLVHIILLNWNGWRDTLACVKSLEALDYANYEILVVDNASDDDSVEKIKAVYPDLRLFENDKNLGFGGGCNVGIRYALEQNADYVWLLNNDTLVDNDALKALVETASAYSRVGAVGSVIFYHDEPGRMQAYGGGKIHRLTGVPRHFTEEVPFEKLDYLMAASLLIPISVLRQVGLFDEGFFMYWEDADLGLRIRKVGWELLVAKDSYIWHKESASLGPKSPILDMYFNRSAVLFFRKHAAFPAVPLLIGVGGRYLKRLLRGDLQRVRAVWTGFIEGLASGWRASKNGGGIR